MYKRWSTCCSRREGYKILANGKCGYCKEKISAIDRDDENYLYCVVKGVRVHRKDKDYLLRCPKCKNYLSF